MSEFPDHLSGQILFTPARPAELEPQYTGLTGDVSRFLDALAGAQVTEEDIAPMREALRSWTAHLTGRQVSEFERPWGHWPATPGRGQTLVPTFVEDVVTPQAVEARVTFGRYYVGENMAAHGGAVALLFDDLLGRLANRGDGGPARTAYLNVLYRAITPIGVELALVGRVDRVEGRKRFLSASLLDGDVVCAHAEGLWVELRMGQGEPVALL